MNTQDIINTFSPAVEKFGGFPSPVKFKIGEDSVIHILGNEIVAEDKDAECTISMSEETFSQVVSGGIDVMGAVMEGDITVEGDSAIAISVQGLF
ncbi:SCP2 sterol-binding domain-containing protein [Sessilibacter corallicola]|uniref:SCP2 sterol-binding domain-containing protein n=1 Tax=Sessilibacter corallicola TaxID=2904075 RepID=UPI001E3FD746|nr:SCP2 sterol-binding domain-containing protein [Sessilibacter corallicola]MCE2030168.1 SCP2 sterol-binding domain-containing protein [Sessilibacter corallicola]